MKYKLNYQIAWVQDISGSAVVPTGPAAHKAMLWRPAGGVNMIQDGYASFIGGGDWNCIYPAGGGYRLYRSFIGGGFENCVESNNSVIAGGITNSILTSNADAAVIAGGANNTVNAPCGAVLGGAGNTVTHPFAAVFGNGVNSVAANTFHVENVNINNMANCTGAVGPITLPVGTMYYCNIGGGRCQVFIS